MATNLGETPADGKAPAAGPVYPVFVVGPPAPAVRFADRTVPAVQLSSSNAGAVVLGVCLGGEPASWVCTRREPAEGADDAAALPWNEAAARDFEAACAALELRPKPSTATLQLHDRVVLLMPRAPGVVGVTSCAFARSADGEYEHAEVGAPREVPAGWLREVLRECAAILRALPAKR